MRNILAAMAMSAQQLISMFPEAAAGGRTSSESFHLTATTRKVTMTSELCPGPVQASFDFDHDRIFQVLANLVSNAMKFTPAGGSIALRLAPTPGGLLFTVRDSGCCIAADQIETVFARFSQATRFDRSGLGLDLYIARCIVEAHGGKIWVESEPGKGRRSISRCPLSE